MQINLLSKVVTKALLLAVEPRLAEWRACQYVSKGLFNETAFDGYTATPDSVECCQNVVAVLRLC